MVMCRSLEAEEKLCPRSAAAAERSQRTLTIIVKFDKQGKVRDLAYHTSKF